MTLTELLTKASIVKVEQLIGKNTASRVGGLFQDLINYFNGKTNTWTTVTDPVDDIENTVKEGDRWITGGMEKIRVNGVWELLSFWKLDEDGNLYTDLNVYSTQGVSAYGSGTGGGGVGGGSVTVYNGLDSTDSLIALSANMGRVLNVTKLDVSAISAWAKATSKPTYGMGEISGLTAEFSKYSLATHAHAWNDITGKPTTFAPSAHNHLWADLSDKPTTFAPSAHDHSFASLTAKPTTLSGYGITDAITSTVFSAHTGNQNAEKHLTAQQLSDLLALINAPSTFWKLDVNGNLYTEKNVYSTLGVSAYGVGSGGSGGGGASALYQLADASISSPAVDHVLVYNGTHWQNRPKSYLLADYSLTTHGHTFASITVKPTTLSGYGITDALLKSDINVQVGGTKNSQMLWTSWDNSNAYGGAIQIREYGNVNNTQSDWYYSPAITFHWGNRSVKRFGMRSDGQLAIDDSPILWSGNYSAYALPLSGGTMTGNLTMGATTDIITNFKTWTKDSSKSLKSFLDKFDIDANGNLVVIGNLYSTGEVTAYSSGTGVSGLKLMGNLDANGKNITGASQIYAGNAYLGNVGINPSLQWYYDGDENTMAEYRVLTGEYFYAANQVKYGNGVLEVAGQVKSSEFKFGNYSFKQSDNGLSICFNGVEQAYITNTGQYVNS